MIEPGEFTEEDRAALEEMRKEAASLALTDADRAALADMRKDLQPPPGTPKES